MDEVTAEVVCEQPLTVRRSTYPVTLAEAVPAGATSELTAPPVSSAG